MLIINFFNLTSLYFRHPKTRPLVHVPVVSGPLAWTLVAILWNGAAMVGAHSLGARILANVAIWSLLGFGFAFLAAFKDYTISFALSVLTACKLLSFRLLTICSISEMFLTELLLALAVHQLGIKVVALQWIFAFIIMSLLFAATLAVAIPGFFGKELTFRRDGDVQVEDRERQPLLDDE